MIATRADLEASLQRVTAAVADPTAGIHGPGSAAWELQRDALIFLGGGRAALLQLAHPFVAYAVDQHSKTRGDVVGRFQRTFANVFAMSFGALDDALAAARRVHAIHGRITGVIDADVGSWPAGTRYHANDLGSLTWVYATLVHTTVQVHELVRGPLPMALKERYYRDTWQFARLFAIPDDRLPPTWAAFDLYVERMMASPEVTVSEPARAMSRFLLGDGEPGRRARLGRFVELVTAGLLPERLRVQYGLPWGLRERAAFQAAVAGIAASWRALPERARTLPAYVDAHRRLAGRSPSALGRWMEQRLYSLASLATGGSAAARHDRSLR